jgi:hypothetical protein
MEKLKLDALSEMDMRREIEVGALSLDIDDHAFRIFYVYLWLLCSRVAIFRE